MNPQTINWSDTIHVEDISQAMQGLADWYNNDFIPAIRAYLDTVADWWENYFKPAILECIKIIGRIFITLRRGLFVIRLYYKIPTKYRPWFPWKVSRWLARRWPVRWLPRFVVGDVVEFMYAYAMAHVLSDSTW